MTAEEARLVREFTESVAAEKPIALAISAGYLTGRADIYLPGTADLIEAKGDIKHAHIRAALAQLLDYATHTDLPVRRIAWASMSCSGTTRGASTEGLLPFATDS